MPKFTPGPWAVGEWAVGNKALDVFSRSADCSIADMASANSDEELLANARLIAAAPDMYKLLKSVVDGSAFEYDIHGHIIFTTKKADEFRKVLKLIEDGNSEQKGGEA